MQRITMTTTWSLVAEARFYSYLGPGTQGILQMQIFVPLTRVVRHFSNLLTASSPSLESFKESTDGTCQERSRSSSTNGLDELTHRFQPSCSMVQLERTREREFRNTGETVTFPHHPHPQPRKENFRTNGKRRFLPSLPKLLAGSRQ